MTCQPCQTSDLTLSFNCVVIGQGESFPAVANFGPAPEMNLPGLLYGDTLATVVSVEQISGPEGGVLQVGSGAINGAEITVEGQTRAASTVVQFDLEAHEETTAGEYVVRVIVTTTSGSQRRLDCRVSVWE